MSEKEVTFESLVEEYIKECNKMVAAHEESNENLPFPPFKTTGPPYDSAVPLDEDTIRRYAISCLGDDNPLFTDPEYGKRSIYGCQICPGTIMALVRYLSVHGPERKGGYPLANFISGAAWEFFDVVRVRDRFRHSKRYGEFVDKKGSKGRLLFLISNNSYWHVHGELVAKVYGTQIMRPTETMGTGRSMVVENLKKDLMYEREVSKYSKEEVDRVLKAVDAERRRGPVPLWWEDVKEGDKLPPIVQPPLTCQDQIGYHNISNGCTGWRGGGSPASYETFYEGSKMEGGLAHTHPVTRWPWTPSSEHEDALLAAFRAQSLPFDLGIQRLQLPERLMGNWMGDYGFLRRMYVALRKVNYYGDTLIFEGEVVKKFKEKQKGNSRPGGVPGEEEYAAVGIKYTGMNQLGEEQTPGTATVYLPSKELGMVKLPIPHPPRPQYVPFDTHRKDWY